MLHWFFIVRRYMNNLVGRGVSGLVGRNDISLTMPFQWLLSKGLLMFKKVLPKQVASAWVVVGRDMLINCAKICLYVDFFWHILEEEPHSVCLYVVVCHLDHSLVIPAPKTKNTVYNETVSFVWWGGSCTNGTCLVEIVCHMYPSHKKFGQKTKGFCVHCPITVMR